MNICSTFLWHGVVTNFHCVKKSLCLRNVLHIEKHARYFYLSCESRISRVNTVSKTTNRHEIKNNPISRYDEIMWPWNYYFFICTYFPFCFAGQRILHHKSNVLETVVLINPSDDAVSTEVKWAIIVVDSLLHQHDFCLYSFCSPVFHSQIHKKHTHLCSSLQL